MKSEFIECSIGDVVQLKQGLAINTKTKHLLKEKGLPLLRITDLLNNSHEQYIDEAKVPKQCIVNYGDLIYTRTGQVGYIFNNRKGVVHNNCFTIEPTVKDLTKDFIYWYFKQTKIQKYAENIASGSVQKDLNHSAFNSIPFKYPICINTQKKIAHILSTLDDKIELNRKMNQTLEEMAQAMFKSWFVDNLQDEWLSTIGESQIQIIDGDRGKNYPKTKEFFNKEYCLFLSTKNVKADGFDFNNCSFITKEKDNILRNGKLLRDDIVLTTRGTVGNIGYYDKFISFNNVRINSGMIILRCNENTISSLFLYTYIKSSYFKYAMPSYISGTAQPQLPIKDLKKIPFILPPKDIHDKFTEMIRPLYQQVFTNEQEIQTLQKTRDTLLPKLLSGEVEVSAIEVNL